MEDIDKIAWANDPQRPMIVTLAHDGDNAYGGGYSYYMENVRDFCNEAEASGYEPTVVAEFLADHPVPEESVAHVEDGAWVNADGDFGSPSFWNWNWPLVDESGDVDIPGGWSLDGRNWAVITAAQNMVETAEQIAGGVDLRAILDPYGSGAGDAELAWHFFLPSVTSGYMYYDASLDMEVKPSIACNAAVEHANGVIGNGSNDATPPTIWAPQRYPYNPGGVGFGSLHGYDEVEHDRDFWVWTFVFDVSGIDSVQFLYRIDADGYNTTENDQNETFAGGVDVGSWKALPMEMREFPAENVFGDPDIDFFVMPHYIADEYYIHVTEQEIVDPGGVLIDYFVRAVDLKGYEERSDIFHLYVDTGGAVSAPYIMDGFLDSAARALRMNGDMTLWADFDRDGGYLYVATDAALASTDHFIFVAAEPGQLADAPWAKAGMVAEWDCYLADEGENSYTGWFDLPDGARSGSADPGEEGAVVEGYVHLADLFGFLPDAVYLAGGVFGIDDGEPLIWQVPGSGEPEDGNLDYDEYFRFSTMTDLALRKIAGR